MTYHVTGLLSAVIFLFTVSGLWAQLRLIWTRKHDFARGVAVERPTAILSLNQFGSSFLAFYSFFLYGACLQRFNHYLVWSRLVATLMTLAILYEIQRDRRERRAALAFFGGLALVLAAPVYVASSQRAANAGRFVSAALVVVVTVVLAQGYLHQVALIRRTGRTGAVALRLHQFFFLKDASTIAFALAMGGRDGWPLLLLSGVSAATKLATMWHFRWVRLSPVARQRREAGETAAGPAQIPIGEA
jgi:hypothetical protein